VNVQSFVDRRRENWARLAELLDALQGGRRLGREGARELLRLYRRAAADLAEAQTHLPDEPVREELELLVGRAYGVLYGQAPGRVGAGRFFAEALPRAFRANAGYFAFALGTLLLAAVAGAAMAAMEQRWAAVLLPPAVVESVQQGRLWTGLFSMMPSSLLSTVLFYNNAMVCFAAFALGLAFGVGTIYVLSLNGLMLGAAAGLCWRHGMLGELAAFAVGHGVLEVSAILLAGAGGLMLGDALARPGPYRRLDALRLRAREAATLAVGALPFLAAAALIEGTLSVDSHGEAANYILGLSAGALLYAYLLTAARRESRRSSAVPTEPPATWRPGMSGRPQATGNRHLPPGSTRLRA